MDVHSFRVRYRQVKDRHEKLDFQAPNGILAPWVGHFGDIGQAQQWTKDKKLILQLKKRQFLELAL